MVVIDDNKNKILDDENSEYRENNCDNQSVRESITRLRFDLAEEEWFESTEEQKINLKKNNSSKHLPIDFSSQTPEMQKNIWDNCVSNFDFKEFGDRLMLAATSIKELASKLEEFKLKIIHSILRQNRYFIDKKKLESIPDDGSFFIYVIYMCNCIGFPSRKNFCDKQGNKITTLITELSKWMKGKKLTIFFINYLLFCYYKDIYQCLASENLELDEPLLSLDNLKKIILCIDFNQNKNTDRCYNEIYCFFCSVCDLLIGMKQDNQYIKVYIANLLSYFGYKTEGIENVENQPESLSNVPTAKEFYENTTKSEGGLGLLMCIKALGFRLVLAENEIFKLEQVDEVDKLIASIGYQNDKELNNWVKGVNTINEEDRNEIAEDENANDNYLEITSFDDFKNMKKNSIVSFIEKSKNANELKKKYQVLLEKDKQDKLDEVILNKDVVDWILHNLKTDVFEEKDVRDVIDIIKKFYKYTDEPNAQISSLDLMFLLSSFKEESLTNNNVNLILEINGKNDGYELEAGNGKMRISYLFYILRSLNERQGIPEKLITLIMQTIDFESTDLNNDNDRYYFYGALFFLIRCSGKYDENNPKEAIKDVFKGTNKILNELLKIQDAKDYLNVGVMQKAENFGSRLAYLFVNSGLKISFEDQGKNQLDEMKENKINENDNNIIENANKSGKENNDENDLKFELKEMDEIDKLIIELSKDENLNRRLQFVDMNPENHLEIVNLGNFQSMKRDYILKFIKDAQDNPEFQDKYATLLKDGNHNRLDEVILDKNVTDWMLQIVLKGIFEQCDFDAVTEVVKKFYQYTNVPNDKASPVTTINLLMAFMQNSLSASQMLELLKINDWDYSLNPNDLDHDLYKVWSILSALKTRECIPKELFFLINQTVDFNSIDLNNDGETESLFNIITCLIEHSKKYDPENVSKVINDIFGYQVDDISEESQACRKFVRESLLKIPSCQERINELLEISQKPDYEKKLVKMFSSDGISKITIKEELGEEEEMGEYEEEVVSYESESENNNGEIERGNSLKLKSSKNLLAKIDIEDQNPNFDTKSVKNLDMDINKLFFNIGIDNEDNDKNTKLANELESLKNKNLELLNRLQQVDAENNQLKNVIYEKERMAEELKNLNDKSENENDYGKIKRYNEEYNVIQNESICFQREKNKIDKNLKSENTNLVSELEDLKKRNAELLNELEQLKAKISEYKNNQVQEISNVNPKTQSKPNKKLKYTLYIFALIIAVASVAIGFYMSLYAFLGLIVSLILLFVVSYLNSKSQEGNNFKLITDNIPSMTESNLLNKYQNIAKKGDIFPIKAVNQNEPKNNEIKDGNS